jgi:hypothetical protein
MLLSNEEPCFSDLAPFKEEDIGHGEQENGNAHQSIQGEEGEVDPGKIRRFYNAVLIPEEERDQEQAEKVKEIEPDEQPDQEE